MSAIGAFQGGAAKLGHVPTTGSLIDSPHDRFSPSLHILVRFLKLTLQPLDHFLTEVAPLGQLFLHLLVDLYFPLIRLDLLLHFVVLEDEDLSLLGLVFELCSQLMVLKDCEMGSRL